MCILSPSETDTGRT